MSPFPFPPTSTLKTPYWYSTLVAGEPVGREQKAAGGGSGAELEQEPEGRPRLVYSAPAPLPPGTLGTVRGVEGVSASAAQMWGCESPLDLFLHSEVAKRLCLAVWRSFSITIWFKAALTNGMQNSFPVQLYSKWHLTALSECWWMFFN